jgi:hypothetical protein
MAVLRLIGIVLFSVNSFSTQEAHNAVDFKHSCFGEPGSSYWVSFRFTPRGPGSLSPFDPLAVFWSQAPSLRARITAK